MKNQLGWALAFLFALVGCSSTHTVADSQKEKAEFVQESREKLNDLETKSNRMSVNQATDAKASINDARAELISLESSANWESYKPRVETLIDKAEAKIRHAE